jgi:hypothetical protein
MRRPAKFCPRALCLGLSRCAGMLAFGLRSGVMI